MKTCKICNEEKPFTEFHKSGRAKGGHCKSFCKSCQAPLDRELKIIKKYGLTQAEFEAMTYEQDGKCKICGKAQAPLSIDHCHETGKVRGLLCRHCNTGLGHFKDSLVNIANAYNYISNHRFKNSA